MAIDTIKSSAVLDGAIATADIADDAVTGAKIENNPTVAGNLATGGTLAIAGHGSVGNAGTVAGTRALTVVGATDGTSSSILVGYNSSLAQKFSVRDDGFATIGNGLTLTDGNLVVASGHGIDFSATGDGTTMSNELLDDYEEGTWSPTLDFGGGTTGITYGTRSAKYTKIGNVVYFSMRIYLTSKGSSTGHAHVSGFPFTVGGMPTGGVFQLVPARGWFGINDEPMYVYFANGGTRMAMYYNDWDATSNSAAADGQFANNSEMELTAFYFT